MRFSLSSPQEVSGHATRLATTIVALAVLDVLIWRGLGGLPLALVLLTMAGVIALGQASQDRKTWLGFAAICLGVIPLLIHVSLLSVCLALAAFWGGVLLISNTRLMSFPFIAWLVRVLVRDIRAVLQVEKATRPTTLFSIKPFLRDWWLAVVMGGGFLLLFLAANPVFEAWATALFSVKLDININPSRILFWIGCVMVLWPLSQLRDVPRRSAVRRAISVRPAVLRNALISFNALFALQTATDFAILSGGAALPEAMSMASYVHKGAYPLLVTALLAGVFALVVRSQNETPRATKMLLIAWIGQNCILVITSAIRLDFYVGDFGLTHLRIWAALWMAVTFIGLGLLMWNTWRDRVLTQFLKQAAALGCGAIYLAGFVNFAEIIADHNVARFKAGDSFDGYYTCNLGSSAVVPLQALPPRHCLTYQYYPVADPQITNWRDWGFRKHRILTKLAAQTQVEGVQ